MHSVQVLWMHVCGYVCRHAIFSYLCMCVCVFICVCMVINCLYEHMARNTKLIYLDMNKCHLSEAKGVFQAYLNNMSVIYRVSFSSVAKTTAAAAI